MVRCEAIKENYRPCRCEAKYACKSVDSAIVYLCPKHKDEIFSDCDCVELDVEEEHRDRM